MGGIFNIDGPFYRFGIMLWDIMALSLMWILFSIPIFTAGASTTALFYITTRRIAKKEGYVSHDFWVSFKANFKQATKIWLAILAIGVLLLCNLYVMLYETELLGMSPTMISVLLPFQVLFFVELFIFALYVFPIVSRFNIKGKLLIRTTLLMAHKHLPSTIVMSVMFLLVGYLVLKTLSEFQPFLLAFGPGLYAFSASYFLMRIFKKYRPEMDKTDEELAALQLD